MRAHGWVCTTTHQAVEERLHGALGAQAIHLPPHDDPAEAQQQQLHLPDARVIPSVRLGCHSRGTQTRTSSSLEPRSVRSACCCSSTCTASNSRRSLTSTSATTASSASAPASSCSRRKLTDHEHRQTSSPREPTTRTHLEREGGAEGAQRVQDLLLVAVARANADDGADGAALLDRARLAHVAAPVLFAPSSRSARAPCSPPSPADGRTRRGKQAPASPLGRSKYMPTRFESAWV